LLYTGLIQVQVAIIVYE